MLSSVLALRWKTKPYLRIKQFFTYAIKLLAFTNLLLILFISGRPNQLKRVYELEGLILDLDAHLNGHPINFSASKSVGTELITSTIFDYETGTR